MTATLWPLLADLLEYPRPTLLGELDAALASDPMDAGIDAPLRRFREGLAREGFERRQEDYTQVFDFSADTAPYLGHHLFGEESRRGAFMAYLKKRCGETGVQIPAADVPDHLSLVLRFLDRLEPGEEREELVRDCLVPTVARLQQALERKQSPYADVLKALSRALAAQAAPVSAA
ncbi:MAG TPA: nitrate reductase molybdenum cofactor assembly chaperone [Vicinamibacterales bacterium]